MKVNYSYNSCERFSKALLLFLLFFPIYSFAQNCTVNANADKSICSSVQLTLFGTANTPDGLDYIQDPLWSQISGPTAKIVNPENLFAEVTGLLPSSVYTFRLTATCQDGSTIYDDVVYTTSALTTALAGNDTTYCQGTYSMSANAVGVGESGTWSIEGTNGAGISITTINDPNTLITVSGNSTGSTTLRWTIVAGSCESYDEVVITTLGGVSPVNAGADHTVSKCYSATQIYRLDASFGGSSSDQQGTWTVVSGPSVPTFDDEHDNDTVVRGLVEGTYVFRWTVDGPCVQGSDEVIVTVPPPTADLTNVPDSSVIYCDGRTSIVLQGTVPSYVNEEVQWNFVSGPVTPIIVTPTTPSTTVTGMTAPGTYVFQYSISNSTTNCIDYGTYTVEIQEAISISGGPDQTLGCEVYNATIPVTTSGKGAMSWQIISGPSINLNYFPYPSSPVSFSGSSIEIENLDKLGSYVVRLIKSPEPGASCTTVYDDVVIEVSTPPITSSGGSDQKLGCGVTETSLAGNIGFGGGRGKWTQVLGPSTAIISNTAFPTTKVSGLISGEYQFRWTIIAGVACDVSQSIVTVIVADAIPTTPNAGDDQEICYGPIQLEGNATLNNEIGTWTVNPSTGIVFSDIHDPNATVSGFQQDMSYTFTWTIENACGVPLSDDVIITTNDTEGAIQADAGPDQCLLDGTTSVQLAGNNPSPGTGTWSQVSGNLATITSPSSFNTTVTGLTTGTYTFRWTIDNNGCTTTQDDVTITIAPVLTTAAAGPDQSVCGGSTVTVTGNTPSGNEIGVWKLTSGGDGPIITNPNSPTTTITNLTEGPWTFSWTISNSACGESTDSVKISVSEEPSPAIAGDDQELCGENATTLGATPPTVGTGTWSMISGPNSPVFGNVKQANSTFSGLITGVYILEWTTFNGVTCPSSKDQVTITVREGADAGNDFNTCLNGPLVLEGTIGTTGTWTYISGPIGAEVPVITITGSNSASVTDLEVGDYVFRYTINAQGSCAGSFDDVKVTIDGQASVADAGIDQKLCNTGSIQLAAATPDLGTGKWTVLAGTNTGSFVPNDTDPNAEYVNASSGIYVFNWTVSDGSCSNSDQVRVENSAPPTVANAGPDQNQVCGTTAQLAANTPVYGVGNWSQISGPSAAKFSSQILPNAVVSNLNKGTYVFKWTITNGTICNASEDTVIVTVLEAITKPNAGPDQTMCQSGTVTLAGNTLAVGTGTWTVLSGPTGTFSAPNTPTSTFTPLPTSSGVSVLQWQSSQGSCTLNDTMTLTIDALPTTADAGDSFSKCQFETVSLNGNIPASGIGKWTMVSGPTAASFVDASSPTTEVLGTVAGDYVFQWTISNGICNSSSDAVDVTILQLPSLADAGPDQSICNVNTTTLAGNAPTVGTGTWTFVLNPGNTAVITNPASRTTTVTGISVGTTRLRWTISNGSTCTSYFDEVNIVRPADLAATALTPKVICLGGSATFTTTASGSLTPYTYQWQSSNNNSTFTNIANQTAASYTTPTNLSSGTYYYKVIVSSSCAVITTASARLDVVGDPIVSTQPTGANLCSGSTHEMTVAATGDPLAGALIYQWQNSTNEGSTYSNIASATSTTYKTPALNTTTYYRVKVTQAATGCETYSEPAIVYVASITAQPSNPNAICSGGQLTNMTAVVSLNGGTGTISYQWQSNTDGVTWIDETNDSAKTNSFTSDVLTPSALPQTYNYRVIVTVDYGGGNTCQITSNTVQGIVAPDLNFTTQPVGGTICTGGTFPLSVVASSYANYQWQSSLTGNANDFTDISGATSASYITDALTANTFYRVILSNPAGGCEDVTSDIVEVVVSPDPTIVDNPTGSTVCPGGTHTMSVTVSGGIDGVIYLYQWQITNGSGGHTNISGARSATYTTEALTANATYRVRIKQEGADGLDLGCEVYSNETTVYVATITTQPVKPAVVCVGGTVNLTITASGNGGSDNFTYQWQSSTNGNTWIDVVNPSATTANFTSDALSITTQFRCIVTSTVTSCPITSNVVTATVVTDPTFDLNPQSETICSGGSVTLTANASTGTGTFSYQWQVNTGSGYTDIAGANSSTYTTPRLTTSALYQVLANATGVGCEQAVSTPAQITVSSDPTIETQPENQTICGNGGVGATLTVVSSGGVGTNNYQWQTAPSLGGTYVDIAGATSVSYTTPTNLRDNSYYRVQVSNAAAGCNIVTSNPVTVFVAKVTQQPSDPNPVCIGGSVQMSVEATSNGGTAIPAYQWQSSPNGTTDWSNVTGGTGGTTKLYTTGVFTSAGTTYYRCLISSATPVCNVASNVIKAVVVADPSVTTQPVGGTICDGGTYDLSVVAVNDAAALTYQWQQSANGTTGWSGVTTGIGANSPNYTTGILTTNTYFRVLITSSGTNNGCNSVESTPTLVTVAEKPTFTLQPKDGETCIGASYTFTATATSTVGGTISYQWQSATALNGTYSDVTDGSGAQTANYTTPVYSTQGDRFFRVLVSQDTAGCENTSNKVPLVVNGTPDAPIVNYTQPSCDLLTGTITISDPDLNTGYQYSLDGGAYVNNNVFTGLVPGSSHAVKVRRTIAPDCESTETIFTINNRICAVPEVFDPIDDIGGTTINSVISSDTLSSFDPNTGLATDGAVNATNITFILDQPNSFISLDPNTGQIIIAPQTPAGIYEITYTICEIANPSNCSSTTENIEVTTNGIVAILDEKLNVNGYTGLQNAIPNVLVNDRYKKLPVDLSIVTLKVLQNAKKQRADLPSNTPVPVFDVDGSGNYTGSVSVPPGTAAGTYRMQYQICALDDLTLCDEAYVFITVVQPVILAINDYPAPVNGYFGSTNPVIITNVLTNDRINPDVFPFVIPDPIPNPIPASWGSPITITDVNLKQIEAAKPINGGLVPLLSLSTGNVTVPKGTPAGNYVITYYIEEKLNPGNISKATVNINVTAPPIIANDEEIGPIDGYVGQASIINAYTHNDTFNGVLVNADLGGDLTPSILIPASPKFVGAKVPTMDVATGKVSVPAGTPEGRYTIKYQICDNLNPAIAPDPNVNGDLGKAANCDDAVVVINVIPTPIDAVNDQKNNVNGYVGANAVLNAYANDLLSGASIVLTEVTPKLITAAAAINGQPVPVLNLATGDVDVPAGTPKGTYTITYQICEKLNPTNCDLATITINVVSVAIDAVDDEVSGINGFVGKLNAINAFDNDLLNGIAVVSDEVIITRVVSAIGINGGQIPALDPSTGIVSVPAGTTAGKYEIYYELTEVKDRNNYDFAKITINVVPPVIEAKDDAIVGVNSYTGLIMAGNALDNDELNGIIVDKSFVTIKDIVPATSIDGGLVPLLDIATGIVTVPAGTPAGDYEIGYTIFEKLNPTNEDGAVISIEVIAGSIVAIDDEVSGINGYVGLSNAINSLDNDKLNGELVAKSQVTISNIVPATAIDGGNIPVLDAPTGIVSIPAGTTAGQYVIGYTISENLNELNTDSATITINVLAPPIVANDDESSSINGDSGADAVLDALTNDTLNQVAASLTDVTITVDTPAVSINGGQVPVLDVTTGLVNVPAGTPAGMYTIDYSICEKLNSSNCDQATITINVIGATIIANPDLALDVNGFEGDTNVLNALDNDTLNGNPVQLSEVSISVTIKPDNTNALEPVLDTATGIVSVPAGTPAGNYTINYQICELLNPTNCSISKIVVTVRSGAILAVDDFATNINGNDGANAVVDILINDKLDVSTPTVADVVITITSPADAISGGLVPSLDVATGLVNVPAGTSSGVYTITYQICEVLNLMNCDEAVIKITVSVPEITLVKRGTFVDGNGNGFAEPGETIRYNFLVENTGAIDLTNVIVTDPKVTVSGNPIASLVVGASNTTNFTATYTLTQTDINSGEVINQATVTALPIFGTQIQDLSDSDDPSLLGNDDPTVTPVMQRKELTLIKGGSLIGDGSTGDTIEYSFVVTNTGNVILTNVEIDDPLFANPTITVTPSTLAPGESGTGSAIYSITVGDVANGEVVNSALAVGDAPDGTYVTDVSDSTDPTLPSDDDPTVIDLSLNPSIAIVKKGTFVDANGNGYAEIGETINYTFTVTNTGNVVLVNIVVDDSKPGLIMSGGPIVLRVGETDTTSFTATYTLTGADIQQGSVINQATVNALSPDGRTVSDLSDDNSFTENDPTVVPLNSCEVTIHNAISPNGDGLNDYFKIDGIECYPNATVEIYDRWGVLVYDSVGYDNNTVAFKGYSDGRATVNRDAKLPDGTYFYIISYKTYLDQIVNETGYLYISGNR